MYFKARHLHDSQSRPEETALGLLLQMQKHSFRLVVGGLMTNGDEEQPCLVFVSWSVSTLAPPARLKRWIGIPVWDKDSGQPKDEFCSELQIHSKTKASVLMCDLQKIPTFSFFRTELTNCAYFVLSTRNPSRSFSVTEKHKSGKEQHCFHTASLSFVRSKRRGSASYLPCVALVYGKCLTWYTLFFR